LLIKTTMLSSNEKNWFKVLYYEKIKDLGIKSCFLSFNDFLKDIVATINRDSHDNIKNFCKKKANII
jgi:hypothetical protein